MTAPLQLLNGLTPAQFLAEYWQKKPLLIRQAIPHFEGLMTPEELAGLACEEDVESRIIEGDSDQNQWQVADGPFEEDAFTALPENDWTLLVQAVNHHLPEAAALLDQFNFIPHARLDDLMVSYAPHGGSVGAHLDSYDVFLLQGSGTRRWKISTQPNSRFIDDAPIKVLETFEAEEEWVLKPGDMLYLPPSVAHHGVSESAVCMTYSIGFRAPKKQELTNAFLTYLQESANTGAAETLYEDADLTSQAHPAEVSGDMVSKVDAMLKDITWDQQHISDFLGCYLTEPSAHVLFESEVEIGIADFTELLAHQPLQLDLKSRMLSHQQAFYLNGERLTVDAALTDSMQQLADHRILETNRLSAAQQNMLANTLHDAYMAGYINCFGD